MINAARRRRYLARRRRKGLQPPAPVKVISGNCMSVSATRAHASAILASYLRVADEEGVDILMLSECSDFRAQDVADSVSRKTWRALQFGNIDSPESGSAILIRRHKVWSLEDPRLVLISEATSEGGGIRRRSAIRAKLSIAPGTKRRWTRYFSAMHLAPPRAPQARWQGLQVALRMRGIRGGDTNYTAAFLLKTFARAQVFVTGVLATIVPGFIEVGEEKVISKSRLDGADHDGVMVTLWP